MFEYWAEKFSQESGRVDGIVAAWLGGSLVNGTANPGSDLDVRVAFDIFPPDEKALDSLVDIFMWGPGSRFPLRIEQRPDLLRILATDGTVVDLGLHAWTPRIEVIGPAKLLWAKKGTELVTVAVPDPFEIAKGKSPRDVDVWKWQRDVMVHMGQVASMMWRKDYASLRFFHAHLLTDLVRLMYLSLGLTYAAQSVKFANWLPGRYQKLIQDCAQPAHESPVHWGAAYALLFSSFGDVLLDAALVADGGFSQWWWNTAWAKYAKTVNGLGLKLEPKDMVLMA